MIFQSVYTPKTEKKVKIYKSEIGGHIEKTLVRDISVFRGIC